MEIWAFQGGAELNQDGRGRVEAPMKLDHPSVACACGLLLLAGVAAPLAACSDDGAATESSAAGPTGPGEPVDPGTAPDSGPGARSDAAAGLDGGPAPKPTGAPATATGKIDGMCMFTGNPFRRDDLLLVDPSGKRIAYPRLVGTSGELVIRDLETDKVTKLGSLGTCTYQVSNNSNIQNWFADAPVSWMRSTPHGLLFADVDGALRLVDWTGAEKAHLPPTTHTWKSGEVTTVDASAAGIRAVMVKRTGAAARLVTFSSDGGAGVSVESADLTPTFAANADVDAVTSGDGGHVAVIVAAKTLYAAASTAGATATVLNLSNARFRAERTPHGAFVTDLANVNDDKALLRHVDFTTALHQTLTHYPAGVVTASKVGASLLYSEITSSDTAATGLTTWRFDPGAPAASVANTVPTSGNTLHYGTFRAETTADLSSYVFSLDGTDNLKGQNLVYSVSLAPAAAAYRPARVARQWALGGAATLATIEGTTLRFENLSSGAVKTTPFTDQTAQLTAVSVDGHLGFFEVLVYDATIHTFMTGIDVVSDAGGHRVLRAPQNDSAIGGFLPAWSDGLVAVLKDGFYFVR
jgi:hypothetical protein